MANELQGSYVANASVYALLRTTTAQIWSVASTAFQNYNSSNYSGYAISATQQGVASAYYTASMPAVPAGTYNAVFKNQTAGFPQESDATVDAGSIDWNGSGVAQLSDISISGLALPVQIQRGTAVPNYPFYLRSSVDHITPFTSGIVSGQIARDNGLFGPLQSGAFTEIGHGFYVVQSLTSGDTNAGTFSLLFTANNISGGSSDPLPQTFITQRSSGQL